MKITLLTGKIFKIENSTDLPLKAISSSRYRRLSLRIDQKEHKAIVNIPPNCSINRVLDFIEKNRCWIETHLLLLPEIRNFAEGDKISFFGEPLIIRHYPYLKSGVICENGELKVSGDKTFLSRRVRDFIYRQTQKKMTLISQQKAQKIDCKINKVTIKDTKSRWGSCSTLNNINYNWRIALAPVEVIDYLAAHEVAHLKHLDHSHEFWNCLNNLTPFAHTGRRWLQKNGRLLYAYK